MLRTVTVTPGSTAPDWSVTVPRTSPEFTLCASGNLVPKLTSSRNKEKDSSTRFIRFASRKFKAHRARVDLTPVGVDPENDRMPKMGDFPRSNGISLRIQVGTSSLAFYRGCHFRCGSLGFCCHGHENIANLDPALIA